MIRTLLILWFMPVAFFWSWYGLSFYDMNFGTVFFSRALHDQVFAIYGELLGIDPGAIPAMVARALAFDSLIVLCIVAFRRRKAIAAFLARLRASPSRA